MSGFICAIADGGGHVKIGWSRDPTRRCSQIGNGCPSTRLLGFAAADRNDEAEIHKRFSPWRVSGEWFQLTGPVADFVKELPTPKPKSAVPIKKIIPTSVPELIDAFGGPTAFSRIIGKRPSTASEMKRNSSIAVDYWPKVIEAAAERGIEGVTAEFLMRIHAQEKEAAE